MSSQTKRQARVFDDFDAISSVITAPMRAHISGPHGGLHRHSVAGEKSLINLGEYNPESDTAYDWPGRASDSIIDLGYTKVFIDDALLLLFSDLVGTGSTVAPVTNYPNRVRSSSISFKDNGEDFPRSAVLLRDIKSGPNGDTVVVRGSDGGDSFSLQTYVAGFKGEVIAAVIDAPTSDAGNHSNQSAHTYVDKIAGDDNCITLTVDGTSYDGLADGDITETYTIEVISGSIGGDLTTARLRITSASGHDDVDSKAPRGAGGFTAIGTRGLEVEFDNVSATSCSSAAVDDGVSPTDLIAGQIWRVRVAQAFSAPTPTSSGTYTGTWDLTYIVEVTLGGRFADEPQITVSSDLGVDASGPTKVTASATAVAIGTKGARIAFAGTALCKGDKYRVTVTAESEGAMQTLILGHDLPDEIQDAADLDLKIYLKKNLSVTKNRTGFAPTTNWTATEDTITIAAGIIAYDSEWVDGSGDQVALDVEGGTIYAEFREWLTTYVDDVGVLDDKDNVEATLGPVHPDNPLSQGVHLALTNSHGVPVKFTAVRDPDDADAWDEVLAAIDGSNNIYNLAPMTQTKAIQDTFAASINGEDVDELAQWRAGFFNLAATTERALVASSTSSDGEVVLAKLVDDPDTSGTQYTYLQLTSDNVELTTKGVAAGDTVRFLFSTDGFGGDSYSEFAIETIVNETTIRLADAHTAAITTPQKVEIWHTLSKAEIAADLATRGAAFASDNIVAVWPDNITITSNGAVGAGYFACAALAGYRSATAPHQGLVNCEITGFTLSGQTALLGSGLKTMGAAGVWVIVQDEEDGLVFTKYAVTTDVSTLQHREEVVRFNKHSILYACHNNLRAYIGQANVVPTALAAMRVTTEAVIEGLKSSGVTQALGGQLIDGKVTNFHQHATLLDRVVIELELTLPYPLNTVLIVPLVI